MIVLAHFPLPGLSESRAPEQLTEETGKKKKITIKYLQLAHYSTLGWSGLPFPSPGDFTNPEIKSGSPAL